MPVTQDRLTRLREFGLSDYAARAYLALLDLGIAEARDVSSISKVPQAKIYHVLEQLHDKGLVVILPEFPKKYQPVPFEDYLMRLHEEHRKAAAAIESERDHLADLFRVQGTTEVGDRGFFTVIRGRRNVISKVEEMLLSAKRDVLMLATAGDVERSAHLEHELDRARKRGVQMRFMVPCDESTLSRMEVLERFVTVRGRELGDEEQSAKVAILLVDGEHAFLVHFVPDDGNLYHGKDIGVFTDQEAMVAAVQAIVEPLWRRAPPLEAKRAEFVDGYVPEFTHVYTSLDEAREAFRAALSRGAQEVRAVNGHPHMAGSDRDALMGEEASRRNIRYRHILNAADLAGVDERLAAMRRHPGSEVRHLRPPMPTRQALLDEREVFFTIGGDDDAGGRPGVVVHTNTPAVVASVGASFEAMWENAVSLEERRRELELFPELAPGDLATGRLFDLMGDAVVVVDPDGLILLCNPAATDAFGMSAAQARRRRVQDLLDERSRAAFEASLARVVHDGQAGSERVDLTADLQDGRSLQLEANLSRMARTGGCEAAIVVLRDVTARRQHEEESRQAASLLNATLEGATDGLLVIANDHRIMGVNRRFREMWRIPDDVLATNDDDQLVAFVLDQVEDPDAFTSKVQELYASPDAESFDVIRFKDGRVFERYSKPQRLGERVVGRVWSFRDVTQREASDRALWRTQARFRQLFDDAPTGLVITDLDARVIHANDAFVEMLGHAPGALDGTPVAEIVDPAEIAQYEQVNRELLDGKTASADFTQTFLHNEGRTVRARLHASLVRDADGEPMEVVVHARAIDEPAATHDTVRALEG